MTVVGLRDKLFVQGYKVYLEVEDYVFDNRSDFIGISMNKITFVHKYAAKKLRLNPEDVLLSLLVMLEQDLFIQTGMDGNTKIYSLIKV